MAFTDEANRKNHLLASPAGAHPRQRLVPQIQVTQLGAVRTSLTAVLLTRLESHRTILAIDQTRIVHRNNLKNPIGLYETAQP